MRCGGRRPDWRPCDRAAAAVAVLGEQLLLPLCPRCAEQAALVPDVVVRPLRHRARRVRRPA